MVFLENFEPVWLLPIYYFQTDKKGVPTPRVAVLAVSILATVISRLSEHLKIN